MSSTSATALLATVAVGAGALAAWSTYRLAAARNSRVLVLVSGTLQDGFPLRGNLDSPGAPAEFVGWALVRGVKMYLDPKPEGCREWVDPRVKGAQQHVNPALVCTGDPKDANVYACFAVSESAALRALLGEPRMLGMTPDTVLVDLNAEVVAHATPRGAVAAEPAHVKADGTRVTSFAPCLRHFAGGAEIGTEAHEEGLEAALRRAQGAADLERDLLGDDVGGGGGGGGWGVDCYGTAPNTLRFNAPLPVATLRRMLDGTFAHST